VLYDSGAMTGATATKQVSVSLTGRSVLRLVADTNGSANYDHGDWADAKITCGSAPPPPPPPTDTTPPTITSRSPASGATGVSLTTTVTATFSEAMASSSVSGTTFTLTKQGSATPVSAAITYDSGTTTARLTPAAPLDASSTYTARVQGGTGGVTDTAGNALAADSTWTFTTTAGGGGGGTTSFLSDLTPTSATSGWGPYEKDRSNGEQAAGDGRVLTLNGVTFAKGLGVHAASDLRYALSGCSSFTASVGVDDEVGSSGNVIFRVYGDDVLLYDSGSMTGATATKPVSVSLTGRSVLRLVVDTNGSANSDHADWADAKITCGP
jgi:hypothetical protein